MTALSVLLFGYLVLLWPCAAIFYRMDGKHTENDSWEKGLAWLLAVIWPIALPLLVLFFATAVAWAFIRRLPL